MIAKLFAQPLFLLVLLASLWGPSFMFMKVALAEVPPVTLVVMRVGTGGLILLAVLVGQGRRLGEYLPVARHVAFMGSIGMAVPFVAIAWGQQHIDSALASIINGTTPLFTVLLAHLFIADEHLTRQRLVGLLTGFTGLCVLIGPSFSGSLKLSLQGMLAVTFGASCYGMATTYARSRMRNSVPLVTGSGQLLCATTLLLPVALAVEQPWTLGPLSPATLGAVFFLGALGSAAALLVFYRLVTVASAGYTASVTYLIPVVGVVSGMVFLGETLRWNQYVGGAIILFGVAVANRARSG